MSKRKSSKESEISLMLKPFCSIVLNYYLDKAFKQYDLERTRTDLKYRQKMFDETGKYYDTHFYEILDEMESEGYYVSSIRERNQMQDEKMRQRAIAREQKKERKRLNYLLNNVSHKNKEALQ